MHEQLGIQPHIVEAYWRMPTAWHCRDLQPRRLPGRKAPRAGALGEWVDAVVAGKSPATGKVVTLRA